MILLVMRTALLAFLRDRPAVVLSFLLPVAFFTAFAYVFGGVTEKDPARQVDLAVVDLDATELSRRFVAALDAEEALDVVASPAGGEPYGVESARAAVRSGRLPIALVVEKGFEERFGNLETRPRLTLLYDSSDPIAPRLVEGVVQKVIVTSLSDRTAAAGLAFFREFIGGMTGEQERTLDENLEAMRSRNLAGEGTTLRDASFVTIAGRDVAGEWRKNPIVAFYAAGFGVMFLLFTAAATGGMLLEEAESGTLERVLATRVTLRSLLLGKLLWAFILGFAQLTLMFAWGAAFFDLIFFPRFGPYLLIAIPTVLATSAFGILLAAVSRTRAQSAALSTIVVLIISAIGGSMFPRFLMPEGVRKLSLVFFNSWALEGFLDVFWRGETWRGLLPEIAVLLGTAALFFAVALRLARRWGVG
jgi:ABC-2 type transport system permease protein